MSLLKIQREALNIILNPIGLETQWKILIFDTHCQNILSTLYKVGELRELCITLHLNINQKRDRLHGVISVYFLQPTQENIKLLQEDFQSDLYDQMIINFCSPVSDQLIQQLAKSVTGTKALNKIMKVVEHNVDFTSLASNLFTFNIKDCYLNVPATKVATQLYSLLMTLKMQPIILYRIKKENRQRQSQIVAEKLIEIYKEQDYDIAQNEWPQTAVILLERDDDLLPVMAHPISYGALVHDIFGIENNKVQILKNEKPVHYDMSPINDYFWESQITKPFPEVTNQLNKDLETWLAQYNEITGQQQANDQFSNVLQSALEQVPMLQQQKRLLDQHYSIAELIMMHFKMRNLDKYWSNGVNILQQSQNYLSNCKEVLSIVSEKDQYDQLRELDKTRILIMALLTQPNYEEYMKLEKLANISDENYLKAIKYIKQKTDFGELQGKQNQQQSDFRSLFSSLATKFKNHGKGILKLVSGEKKYDIIQLLEQLLEENKLQNMSEFFKIYDCRNQKDINFENIPQWQSKNSICFFVDGASMNEYAELSEYANKINQNVIYGSSEIVSASTQIKYFQMCYDEQNKQQKK